MTLTAKDVAEITRLLEESSFDELYLELDGVKLSLKRNGAGGARPLSGPATSNAAPPSAAGPVTSNAVPPSASGPATPNRAATSAAAPHAPAEPKESRAAASQFPAESKAPARAASSPVPSQPSAAAPTLAVDANVHNVTSPLLGTYYRAPKPGAPPYVEVGSIVDEDTIIGIIEVMKLMNTVRAGVRGRVAEIPARDGTLVEYGETLLRIAKSG